MSDYSILLQFPTDDEPFALGFEAGRIWQRLRNLELDDVDGQVFHAANTEVVLRMIEALDLEGVLRADIEDDTWMVFRRAHQT